MIASILLMSMPGAEEWLLFLLPYFIPTIIALIRKNPNTLPIFIINLFLGWTILGWIGALIAAFSGGFNPYANKTTPTAQPDKADQLRKFKQLLDDGIITNEEFDKQKAAILS